MVLIRLGRGGLESDVRPSPWPAVEESPPGLCDVLRVVLAD
jgi:hypothetical protein